MSKMLQSYIDEAKRNAKSVNTGWSITLLAYVDELEKEINRFKIELHNCDIFMKRVEKLKKEKVNE